MSWGPRDTLVALLPLLVAAVVVGAGVGPTAAAGAADPRDGASAPVAQTGDEVGPTLENTTLTAQLRADGSVRWTVTARFDLATDNEAAAFRRLAEEYTAGETASLGLPAFRAAAAEAADATGREMTVTDVERSASPESDVANGTGRLTLAFTWTNFARVDGDRLVVGDAFEAGAGESAWLTGLDADQRLVIEPPPGYGVISASDGVPAPRNGTITWEGPTRFGDDAFTIAFTGSDGPTTPPPEESLPPWLLAGGVVVAAAVVYVALRRSGVGLPPGPAPDADADAGADASETAADGAPATAGPRAGAGDAAGNGGGAGPEGAAGAADDGGTDEELLSDEERVERLLEENGGRMKQANIVRETGWSNAKVSQLLSSMDEEGRIDKLRIGRENLISFPDEDLTDLED